MGWVTFEHFFIFLIFSLLLINSLILEPFEEKFIAYYFSSEGLCLWTYCFWNDLEYLIMQNIVQGMSFDEIWK